MCTVVISAQRKSLKRVGFQLLHLSDRDLTEYLCKEKFIRMFLMAVAIQTYQQTLEVTMNRAAAAAMRKVRCLSLMRRNWMKRSV